jgi:hypothetical protein
MNLEMLPGKILFVDINKLAVWSGPFHELYLLVITTNQDRNRVIIHWHLQQ